MSAQQIADIVILGGAVAFGVYGMWRGAIRQLGSVAAFLCAFLMARLFGLDMADWLGGVNPMIGYTLVFALVFIGISLIASVLKFTANLLMLGAVDRLAAAYVDPAESGTVGRHRVARLRFAHSYRDGRSGAVAFRLRCRHYINISEYTALWNNTTTTIYSMK